MVADAVFFFRPKCFVGDSYALKYFQVFKMMGLIYGYYIIFYARIFLKILLNNDRGLLHVKQFLEVGSHGSIGFYSYFQSFYFDDQIYRLS